MPSSDPQTIPKVLQIVRQIMPASILDIGCGNGRYGFLFRESLDWDYGRLKKETWKVMIDAVEIEPDYITPIHDYIYTNIYLCDWMLRLYEFRRQEYDLIFMGDVLEHFPEPRWKNALEKAKQFSRYTLIVAPNWQGSTAQGAWQGYEHERHHVALSPEKVGGRCLFANSKTFITIFDNWGSNLFEGKDVLL